jgi:Right handed beta helix region
MMQVPRRWRRLAILVGLVALTTQVALVQLDTWRARGEPQRAQPELPILPAEPANAGTAYHVDSDGRDDNPGTSPETAWRTIDRANHHDFRPGDRLLFAGGKTFPGNLVLGANDAGTPGRPVVVGTYGRGPATIKAGLGTAILVKDADGVEVRDLVCDGDGPTKNHGCGVAFVNTLPGNVRLKHVRIRNVEARGFGCDINASVDQTRGFRPPAGCGIFVGGAPADQSKSGFEDIRIDGCELHENEFYGALVTGCWDEKATRYSNIGLVVADCRFHDNTGDPDYRQKHSGSGILVEDTDSGRVERCAAWENGALCNKAPGGPCGIWTAGSRRITIQHCESFRNRTGNAPDGDGFDLDGGSIECVLQYNYSHDNDGAGILVYTYPYAPLADRNNIVRYNICENDAVKLGEYGAIHVGNDGHGMSGVEIYNNTFISGRSARTVVSLHGKDIRVAFRNNLILAPATCPLVTIDHDSVEKIFEGNLYWAGGGPFKIKTTGANTCDSLEAWRRTGKETIGGKAVGLFADPRLDLTAPRGQEGDLTRLARLTRFRPTAGSPVVDAGLNLEALFNLDPGGLDFLGTRTPQGNAPDIGAIEIRNRAAEK